MTPLAALALAIRDRLVAGAPAPLPGLGTLGRAHVSARVHTDADGRRVLLPPGEAVGLSTRAYDPADLAAGLARRSGVPASAAAGLLREAVDQIEARLAITGDARIDGIGVFQRTSGGVRFAPAPEILAAVNRPFEGLAPVEIAAPMAPPASTAPASRPHVPPSLPVPDAPPDAVDILLDLIVNEPTEPADQEPSHPEPADLELPRPAEAAHPTDVSPAESAFADDLPLTAAAFIAPFTAPEAPTATSAETIEASAEALEDLRDEAPVDADEADSLDEGFAVPFGDGGPPLRDLLPPTETDWHPAPLPDGNPLNTLSPSPDLEDAEVLLPPAEPPAIADTHALLEPTDAWTDAAPGEAPVPAEPALATRSTRPLWPALYVLLVLSLSSLVVWWTVSEQHPRIISAGPATPALPADSPR